MMAQGHIDSFYALRPGHAPYIGASPGAFGGDHDAVLMVYDLGQLIVATGKVTACDPGQLGISVVGPQPGLPGAGPIPVFSPIPIGRHPVRLTATEPRGDSHRVPAYLSLVFSDEPAAMIEPWIAEGGESQKGEPADNFVSVDGDIVGILDAGAASRASNDIMMHNFRLIYYNMMNERARLHKVYCANLTLPFAENGENLALSRSGKGNGAYPVIATRDIAGNITGLHIDFAVVGPISRKEWWKGRHTHGSAQSGRTSAGSPSQ